MTNPGSSIIAALGAGSGIDFIGLADDLSNATFAVQRQNLESRNEALEARISAAGMLRSSLNDLAAALGERVRTGDLAPRGRIDNPAIASVATQPGAIPRGRYSLEVTQLAQGQTLVSQPYDDIGDLVGEGTLRIRFGAIEGGGFTTDDTQAAIEIDVDAADTLVSLAAKINAASDGAISANALQGANGAQLVLKGREGASNGFVLEPSSINAPAAAPGSLSYLAWSPATDVGELRTTPRDANFLLDTVPLTSATNRVTGLPEGITLQLNATNAGSPTTLAFSNDASAITSVMGDFVSALNDVVSRLGEVASPIGGELGNDTGARELRRDLSRLTSVIVMPNATAGEPSTLADLGLSINRDGSFRLDRARLDATLQENLEGTAAMFTTGVFGVFATIERLARDNSLASDPGSLGGSLQRFERQIENNDERLSRIAEQQEQLRARLTREFAAAERRVASSQSTLSFLQQQVDAWSSQRD